MTTHHQPMQHHSPPAHAASLTTSPCNITHHQPMQHHSPPAHAISLTTSPCNITHHQPMQYHSPPAHAASLTTSPCNITHHQPMQYHSPAAVSLDGLEPRGEHALELPKKASALRLVPVLFARSSAAKSSELTKQRGGVGVAGLRDCGSAGSTRVAG